MAETLQPQRLQSVWPLAGLMSVGKAGLETAVMIQGWAHRKTMKCPCLIPCLSSKEENTGQAMAINAARSLRWSARWASGGRKHRWKYQRRSKVRNTATSPPAYALADSNLPGRLRGCGERGGLSKRGVETAVRIQGQAHRKTMKCPRLNPLSLLQGKRREHRSSNGHQRRTLPP
jgi:hypothetical protein